MPPADWAAADVEIRMNGSAVKASRCFFMAKTGLNDSSAKAAKFVPNQWHRLCPGSLRAVAKHKRDIFHESQAVIARH